MVLVVTIPLGVFAATFAAISGDFSGWFTAAAMGMLAYANLDVLRDARREREDDPAAEYPPERLPDEAVLTRVLRERRARRIERPPE